MSETRLRSKIHTNRPKRNSQLNLFVTEEVRIRLDELRAATRYSIADLVELAIMSLDTPKNNNQLIQTIKDRLSELEERIVQLESERDDGK